MLRWLGASNRMPEEVRIRGGLAVRLEGAPLELVMPSNPVSEVALCGADYPDVRPHFLVSEGDRVRLGQALFADRRRPQIRFAAPAAGVVREIRLGRRRRLEAVVISVEGEEAEEFATGEDPGSVLQQSGLWTSFLARPHGRVPDPDARPETIFVTALDTRPLAPDPMVAIELEPETFRRGISVLRRLAGAGVVICHAPGRRPPVNGQDRIRTVAIRGRHPAGLPGTWLPLLSRVAEGQIVWCIGYADVLAIGHLWLHGRLPAERIVALAGPAVENPGLVRLRHGARLAEVVAGELRSGPVTILSGDVLGGRPSEYLGRYHQQITALPEGAEPRIGGLSLAIARQVPGGPSAAIVPLEALHRALPANPAAIALMRALAAGDAMQARRYGCLALDEEDMALVTRLCQTGADYGVLLRRMLDRIAAGEGE